MIGMGSTWYRQRKLTENTVGPQHPEFDETLEFSVESHDFRVRRTRRNECQKRYQFIWKLA